MNIALIAAVTAALVCGTCLAQSNVRVRGQITAVTAQGITVKSRDGRDLALALPDAATVSVTRAVRFEEIKDRRSIWGENAFSSLQTRVDRHHACRGYRLLPVGRIDRHLKDNRLVLLGAGAVEREIPQAPGNDASAPSLDGSDNMASVGHDDPGACPHSGIRRRPQSRGGEIAGASCHVEKND